MNQIILIVNIANHQKAEDSIPTEDFEISETVDPETNETTIRTITEITLDYDDNECVRGWSWQ